MTFGVGIPVMQSLQISSFTLVDRCFSSGLRQKVCVTLIDAASVLVPKDFGFTNDLSAIYQEYRSECLNMHRSKLESYEAILEALVDKPLPLERIAFETTMDCTVLNGRMKFLVENGLVELRAMGKKGGYAITERGVAVLKALSFQKYLNKVASKLTLIDEAMQVVSKHSRNSQKTDG